VCPISMNGFVCVCVYLCVRAGVGGQGALMGICFGSGGSRGV